MKEEDKDKALEEAEKLVKSIIGTGRVIERPEDSFLVLLIIQEMAWKWFKKYCEED